MSFPRSEGQIPVYHSMLPTGRPTPDDSQYIRFVSDYIDSPNAPLFAFGYGLSYSRIEYAHAEARRRGGDVTVNVTVNNVGDYDVEEVVQLYVRDDIASISRPLKELKAFRRVLLKAGESKDVSFTITPEMLSFYNNAGEKVIEEGSFSILAGPNAEDLPLRITMDYRG
jgi:beta-glucosidase